MAESYQLPVFEQPDSSETKPDRKFQHETEPPRSLKGIEKFDITNLEEENKILKRENYSEFDSTKFNKVETLLTNVEEYSKRIREDVDQYAHRVTEDITLLKSECELELAQALIIKKEAQNNAQKLLQEARNNRDQFVEKAEKEGFDAGYAAGMEKSREKNETNTHNVLQLLKELQNLRLDVLHQHEKQIVQLSLVIAKKVIRTQLNVDKQLILNMVRDVLTRFEGMGDIKIAVNPIEFDFMAQHQPEIAEFLDGKQDITLKKDPNVKPAAALIESSFTAVDLDLQTQLKEIENHLKSCIEERRQILSPK